MAQRTAERHFTTMTELLARDEAGPAEEPRRPPPPPVHVWGEGRPLGAVVEYPGRPLSPEQEGMIRLRLGRLLVIGREARIEELMEQLRRAPLPPALRGDVDTWAEQFAQINPALEIKRALALAILLMRLIRPHCLRGISAEDKLFMLTLAEQCRDMIQSLLPEGASGDDFIKRCEEGLQDKDLLEKDLHQADLLRDTGILRAATHAVGQLIEETVAAIQPRLRALQERRREIHRIEAAEVEALATRVDQLRQLLLCSAEGLMKFGEKDKALRKKWLDSLKECEEMLKRLK